MHESCIQSTGNVFKIGPLKKHLKVARIVVYSLAFLVENKENRSSIKIKVFKESLAILLVPCLFWDGEFT